MSPGMHGRPAACFTALQHPANAIPPMTTSCRRPSTTTAARSIGTPTTAAWWSRRCSMITAVRSRPPRMSAGGRSVPLGRACTTTSNRIHPGTSPRCDSPRCPAWLCLVQGLCPSTLSQHGGGLGRPQSHRLLPRLAHVLTHAEPTGSSPPMRGDFCRGHPILCIEGR